VGAFAECFETVFTAGDGVRDEAFVFHHGPQRVANAAFVINNENRIHLLCRRREIDQKLRSARVVLFSADAPAVFENDLLNDRETQTSATVAAREVWLKPPPKISRLDSLPRIHNLRTHEATLCVMTARDRDSLVLGVQ